MWLPWESALWLAVALLAFTLVARRVSSVPLAAVTTTQEMTVVLSLYALWQYVRGLAITKVAGAMEHARSLWRLEHSLHIGSELWIQRELINHRRVMQFLNVYYGGMHVPVMGAVLIWLFVRHRPQYAAVRTSLALLIAGCITIQAMVPMAPPRFLTDVGFVDAGLKYGLSVYGTGGSGVSNELAALPSLHAGWSILAGYAAIAYGVGKWRWLMLLHPVLTMLSIVATGNHWWLDAILSGVILVVVMAAQEFIRNRLARDRLDGNPKPYSRPTPDRLFPDRPAPDQLVPDLRAMSDNGV